MDIVEILQTDHVRVELILRKLISSRKVDLRNTLLNQLKQELEFNNDIKINLFYPILKNEGIEISLVENCVVSLQSIRLLLTELNQLDQNDRIWKFKLFELRSVFLRYANYEKEHVFKHARKLLAQKNAERVRLQAYDMKIRKPLEIF